MMKQCQHNDPVQLQRNPTAEKYTRLYTFAPYWDTAFSVYTEYAPTSFKPTRCFGHEPFEAVQLGFFPTSCPSCIPHIVFFVVESKAETNQVTAKTSVEIWISKISSTLHALSKGRAAPYQVRSWKHFVSSDFFLGTKCGVVCLEALPMTHLPGAGISSQLHLT